MAEATVPDKANTLPPLKPIEGIGSQSVVTTPAPNNISDKSNQLPPLKPVGDIPTPVVNPTTPSEPKIESVPVPTPVVTAPVEAVSSEKKVSIQDQITAQLGDSGKLTGFTIPQTETIKPKEERVEKVKTGQENPVSEDEDEVIHTNGIQKLLFAISILAFVITLLVVLTNL